jgi:cytidylate kinase
MLATWQRRLTLDNTFTMQDIVNFFERQKKRGIKTVEALKEVVDNIDVNFNTQVGREVMIDDINRYEMLLTKVIKEEANDNDRAEMRVILSRLGKINRRLDTFTKSLKSIGGTNGR